MTERLFRDELRVVNVGLDVFADSIDASGGAVQRTDWQPPAGGDKHVGAALAALVNLPDVEQANARAFAAYLNAQPVLEGIGTARDDIPGMGERMILHAGPPVAWERMCGPMQGAVTGAILLEGWAEDPDGARALAAGGGIAFEPNHHHACVGPMAGVTSPSMPVWLVRDSEHGHTTYCNLNEGLGKVLRMGAYDPAVLERLRWMERVLAPTLKAALEKREELPLKPLMAQALHMGDEVHNRNVAASSLLLRALLPALLETGAPQARIAETVRFITGNDHFFLNLSMAACKAMLDAAHGVPGSSMVTAMARNGVEFGIRVSGTGDAWFTTPAPRVQGLFFTGYSVDDAAPDLGDSAITETAGIGGFAMAASPAIVRFVGGSAADALGATAEMRHITLGSNPAWTLPVLDFQGTPAGIDVRKCVDTGIAPVINTGIAHREAGIGQIGAGVTRAPLACMEQAVTALARRLREDGRLTTQQGVIS